MGVNTWAAFAGADDNALVDGDFAVAEAELQPVLKSLTYSSINVVAIHSHMTNENPRILFLHYWARGTAKDLATSLKVAWRRRRNNPGACTRRSTSLLNLRRTCNFQRMLGLPDVS